MVLCRQVWNEVKLEAEKISGSDSVCVECDNEGRTFLVVGEYDKVRDISANLNHMVLTAEQKRDPLLTISKHLKAPLCAMKIIKRFPYYHGNVFVNFHDDNMLLLRVRTDMVYSKIFIYINVHIIFNKVLCSLPYK